jgi:TatD DNase family protein
MLFDAHSHLDMLVRSPSELPSLLEEEFQNGLGALVQVSTDPDIHSACSPYFQGGGHEVYSVCGLPHAFRGSKEEALHKLNLIARAGQLFAIGETGLDYSRSPSAEEREAQGGLFRRQLELAAALDLPAVIHMRDSAEDTLRALDEFPSVGGMVHCYTGDEALAMALLERGYCLSFSGVVTFANAHALRDIVPKMPEDRILVESDAPYLAPVPFRGQKNRPSMIKHTLHVLASLRGCTFEEIAASTAQNARRLLRVPAGGGPSQDCAGFRAKL